MRDAGGDESVAGLLSTADGVRALVQPGEDRTVNMTMFLGRVSDPTSK